MGATQMVTGLVSGLDTTSIVEQLMSIEKASYTKVSEKVEVEKVKLQAYQSVNSMLKSFADSVSKLSSSSLWNSKTTTSSNESSLTASATQYAVNGSYSLRVAQLATSAQYMTKGYSSATSTVLSSSNGTESTTITLESSKAKVDNSAKLEELNGGKGVYRGSIRVTDASGSTTVVDLSACETIDEVVKEINNAAGVQITASVNDDGNGLVVTDQSGGTGTLKIQNVGQGTTATDLGIAGSSVVDANGVKSIAGSSIHYLSSNTLLSSLNDGLGVEEGMMCITVKNASGVETDVFVDLTDMESLGDVLNAVNSAIASTADAAGSLEGLALAVNDDGTGLTFTGGKAGCVYTVTNVWGQDELANPQTVEQLGLLGTYKVENDGDSFGGSRILGGVDSPMLKNISGANLSGVGTGASNATVPSGALDENTLLKDLNGGKGVDISSSPLQIRIYEGGGDSYRQFDDLLDYDTLRALVTTEGATLGDLCDYVNQRFASSGVPALESLELKIDSEAMGVYLDGVSSAHDYLFAGTLAESLGIVYMDAGNDDKGWGATLSATDNAAVDDLYSSSPLGENGNMIYETTTLSDLYIGGAQITRQELDDMLVDGGLKLTIGTGANALEISIDLSGLDGDATVEELYTYVNTMIQNAVNDHDPDMSSPFLTIDYTSTGLWWRNVDLGEDFGVEGELADLLGLSKSYSAAGSGVDAYSTSVQKHLNPVTAGTSEPAYIAATDTLASLNGGSGLSFLGDELTLTFGEEGSSSIVSVGRQELIDALGGNYGSATMNDYLTALNSLFADKIAAHPDLAGVASVTFGPSSDGKGITIIAAEGREEGEAIALGGGMATAASTGLAAATVVGGAEFEEPEAADIRAATVSEADISGAGYIKLTIGGQEVTLDTDGITQDSTLNDLLRHLNSQLADLGYEGVSFVVSDSGSGVALSNNTSSSITVLDDEVCGLAGDLGLAGKTVSGNGHLNGSSLNRNYIGRATSLSSLNSGVGADTGVITVANAQGTSVNIDLSGALTVGDVIDAINGTLYGVKARINDAGDGIVIEQTVFTKADGAGVATGDISVASADGSKTAEHLGISGTGVRGEDGASVLDGSFKTVVTVNAGDTLTDIMNRISAADAGYKTSIINDGAGSNSYRLSITSASSGSGSDFIIDAELDFLGMQQVSKGQDSILLYGNENSGMSPIMLKSSTNSNSQAISGLTLDLTSVSDSYTTITVDTDTNAVIEEIQNLVQCYNDLSDLITYLDSYDTENQTDGILFGDTNIRNLMTQIDDMFYQVYNPNGLSYGDIASASSRVTWSWFDLGISFSTNNTAGDESGTWYSRMELDLDALNDMVTNNWDTLQQMLSGTRNASDSTLASNVAATAGFNWQYDRDEDGNIIYPDGQSDPNSAINGDKTGSSAGFTANKTIDEGENEYTIYFQQATTLERVSIYHQSSSTALKDFTVEYLDANTGKWETLREISGNTGTSTIIGIGETTTVMGIRITASSTNADDGVFRLLDVQCTESTGLAGKLNSLTKSLTDVIDGFYVSVTEQVDEKIADLQDQMEKMEARLEVKEASLWSKFTAMETALSQLQNQSSSLSSLLSSASSS